MLVFAAFVWFTMRFVWPPLARAIEERQDTIAEGMSAAERGKKELELAQSHVSTQLKKAKEQANEIIEQAHKRANQMIDEARDDARAEADRVAKMASEQLAQEVSRAKEGLRLQVANLAVKGAEKIIRREVDEKANQDLLSQMIEEM